MLNAARAFASMEFAATMPALHRAKPAMYLDKPERVRKSSPDLAAAGNAAEMLDCQISRIFMELGQGWWGT